MHYRLKLALVLTFTALMLGGCMRGPEDLPQFAIAATPQVLADT
ncbi:hypothetical protein PSH79_01235 [Pseudomonas sp. FP2196]|nr:hypothetical protein [Pseudomonas sp. FP2196]WLH35942.1 hypothetical protein PSH79_01235 [Pseudomonas sp. FP2196]